MSKRKPRELKAPKPQASIAEKLRARLNVGESQTAIPLPALAQARREIEYSSTLTNKPDEILNDGCDPAFALYAGVQTLLSMCAEILLQMPELKAFYRELERAQEDYLPSYPPMSPITSSHFTMWVLCDLRIGRTSETLAQIVAELGSSFGLEPEWLDIARKLADSRMGIYEHCGPSGSMIALRELVTDKEIRINCESGYFGEKGELWFVRAAPPPATTIPYWTCMGTPHILRAPQKTEWLDFFARNGIRSSEVGYERRLNSFLKFGPDPRYWSEFIFEAYSDHHPGAIFLHGLPDIPESRPHSKTFDPLYGKVAHSN